MRIPLGTTVAVTDGRLLRVFRNLGTEAHPRLEEIPAPAVHGHEDSAPRHRHTGQDNKDQQRLHDRREDKDLQEASFAAAVAAWLNHEASQDRITQWVIVAPPRTLGALRSHYHGALADRLIGEIAKEHTHDRIDHLQAALAAA